MGRLYPFVFKPLFKELVWGGARLATDLGKPCPVDKRIGESWELVDLPGEQSVVAEGPHAGKTLHDLVVQYRAELLGPVATDGGRFPLLVKYIDASRTLSVQVHPDERAAQVLGGRSKSEAWYILGAKPNSKLYIGLKEGTTREVLKGAIERDEVEDLLVEFEPRPGDLFPVLPGTVHAIGEGTLLAEVQQPSDTTYRLHDWGRVGLDGRPRPLHIRESLESIDYGAECIRGGQMHSCKHFLIRVGDTTAGPLKEEQEPVGPMVVVGLDGVGSVVDVENRSVEMQRGRVTLIPHSCRPVRIDGDALKVMFVTFPPAI